MKVYIEYDQGVGPVDYTQYVVEDSLVIEDSVNVATMVNFNLVASNQTFVVPKRSSYVWVVSEVYAASGGYRLPGSNVLQTGKLLATGFISNEPERDFLGMNPKVGYTKFKFQQHSYRINVSSDEWLLNTKIVPFIPAFVNQTQGQILANIAEALRPGFFNVSSFVASGDLVPYYEYDPNQTWSDVAKSFADSSRYRYKVINRTLYFVPFGDRPLGVTYDETQRQAKFDPFSMKTQVLTVPPVNDALVLGDTEPQNQWDNYYIGDGFTSQFGMPYSSFRGGSVTLQTDDWTEDHFDSSQWTVQDPYGVFALAGALNVLQKGNTSPGLGVSYILGKNGIELGGAINVQGGEFEVTDTCEGIVTGVYTSSNLQASACFAGFKMTTPGAPVLTASGAGGIVIQPLLNGVVVGPSVVSQPNHHYQLQIWMGGNRFDRYNSVYRNLIGTTQYGGNALAAYGEITWVVSDIDIGLVIANQYGPQAIGPPVPVVPRLTKYSLNGISFPTFGVFAPINGTNLNLAVNYTMVAQPPQGTLIVQSLTGASGGLLPIRPELLGPPLQYLLGTGFENQTATIQQTGDTSALAFYSDTIPAVGARIRFESWAAGTAMARVIDPMSVAQEAAVSGDDGVRSAIFTNITPKPRTSDECELAAAATVVDRAHPQFQGTYQVFSIPFRFEHMFSASGSDYPRSGRYFYVNAPVRGVSGQYFFASTVRIQVVELREEILQVSIDYGPDLYLEKLLVNFLERTTNVLTPKETQVSPTPVQLAQAGQYYLEPFQNARVTNIVNTISGSFITIDLGAVPVTAAEVRRVDAGWGSMDSNFVGRYTTQVFTLLRTAHDQHWFIRPTNGGKISRRSYVPRINLPLIPGQPFPKALDITNGLSPVVTFDYPQSGVDPGIGFTMTFPQWTAPAGVGYPVVLNRLANETQLLLDNRIVPPGGFAQFGGALLRIQGCPDPSFNGIFTIEPTNGYNFCQFSNPGPNAHVLTDTATTKLDIPLVINTTLGYSQTQNPFVSDVYGLELRGPDNREIILRRVVTAPSDLIVSLTAVSGLLVSGTLSSTGGYLITIYPYFFNLMWDYSAPYALTFDPTLTECCADCINPRDYGALGDGVSDDTAAVQTALSVAGWNAGNTSLFFGSVPGTIHGVIAKGRRVCIQSSDQFVVRPQPTLDNAPAGYQVAACLLIDSGVTLQLDGELVLQSPDAGSPVLQSPWVLLENRHAYSGTEEHGIIIEGSGALNANWPNVINSGVGVTQLPVNSVQGSAVKVCGGYGYIVDSSAQRVIKVDMQGRQVAVVGAPLGSYFSQGGIATLTQIECDPATGNVMLGLGGSSDFGMLVMLDPGGLGVVASDGYSGLCGNITAGVPKYCPNCQGGVVPPCIGNPGDIVSMAAGGGGYLQTLSLTMMVDRINVPNWNDAAIFANSRAQGFALIWSNGTYRCTNACAPDLASYVLAGGGLPGAFYYSGASLSNPFIPAGSKSADGWFIVLNGTAGSNLWVTAVNALGDTSTGNTPNSPCPNCGCDGCPGFCNCTLAIPTVAQYLTKQVVDLVPQGVPNGSPCIGLCTPDNTQILTTVGSNLVFKMTTPNMSVVQSVNLAAYAPIFDRTAFKHIDPATGIMVIRGNDSFILLNTVTLTVTQVYSNVQAQSGGLIPAGNGGSTAYDPTTGSVLFVRGGHAYVVKLGGGQVSSQYGCIRFENVSDARLRGFQLKQHTMFGVNENNCREVQKVELVTPGAFTQMGTVFQINKGTGSSVVDCVVDARASQGVLTFVADYASRGTLVEGNTTLKLPSRAVQFSTIGLDDNVAYVNDGGITVSHNVFASGTNVFDVVVSLYASSSALGYGCLVEGNHIYSNAQQGITIGNLVNSSVMGNIITRNSIGLQKVGGTTLTNVSILNNVIDDNTNGDLPSPTDSGSPVYADGLSTVFMHNPATDRNMYMSWLVEQPKIEGSTGGGGGYVFPPAPPNSFYSVQAVGSSTTPVLTQTGTAATISVAAFTIEWPDLRLSYSARTITPSPNHGYATYHVFVDDPYRDGATNLYFGTTTVLADLATSAGRYYLGSITLVPAGGAIGTGGGMVPPGAQIISGTGSSATQQPYDISCTFDGLVPASYLTTIFPFTRQVTFPAQFIGSQGWTQNPSIAAGGVSFPMYRIIGGHGTPLQVGTMLFASGATFATFSSTSGPAAIDFNPGDVLTVVAPASTDFNFQNFGYTLSGLRSSLPTGANLTLVLSDNLNNWQDTRATNAPAQSLSLQDTLTMLDGTPVVTPGAQIQINMSGAQEDLLNWWLNPSSTQHVEGTPPTNPIYGYLDALNRRIWLNKDASGHPWDGETYDPPGANAKIYHWMTENGDQAGQWANPSAYKRYLIPVAITPRFFTPGQVPVTYDTPGPNSVQRTVNCGADNQPLITIGDIRTITSGPSTVNFGGDIGSQSAILVEYYYSGSLATGIFGARERYWLTKTYGLVQWDVASRQSNGSYLVGQTSTFNLIRSGGGQSVPPVVGCPNSPWLGETDTLTMLDGTPAVSLVVAQYRIVIS